MLLDGGHANSSRSRPDQSGRRAATPAANGSGRHASGTAPALIFGDLWPYDPAPETAEPNLRASYNLFIKGEFVAPKKGKYFESINPATERSSPTSRLPARTTWT